MQHAARQTSSATETLSTVIELGAYMLRMFLRAYQLSANRNVPARGSITLQTADCSSAAVFVQVVITYITAARDHGTLRHDDSSNSLNAAMVLGGPKDSSSMAASMSYLCDDQQCRYASLWSFYETLYYYVVLLLGRPPSSQLSAPEVHAAGRSRLSDDRPTHHAASHRHSLRIGGGGDG